MLEQAEISRGCVLEIGSGGYNAALIAELVGGSRHVTSVDNDPDIVARAQEYLSAAGNDEVNWCWPTPRGCPSTRLTTG